MMGKKNLLLLTTFFLLLRLSSAEIEILEIKNDNSFDRVVNYWCANEGMMKHKPGGAVSIAPDGRSGSCMKISNTEESQTALFSQSLMPVESKEDVFKLNFYIKGKGSFRVGFYTYSQEKKFISTYLAPPTVFDSPSWKLTEYTIPANLLRGEVSFVRIAVEVPPGLAELYFDDFSGQRETPLPEI